MGAPWASRQPRYLENSPTKPPPTFEVMDLQGGIFKTLGTSYQPHLASCPSEGSPESEGYQVCFTEAFELVQGKLKFVGLDEVEAVTHGLATSVIHESLGELRDGFLEVRDGAARALLRVVSIHLSVSAYFASPTSEGDWGGWFEAAPACGCVATWTLRPFTRPGAGAQRRFRG